MKKWFKSALSMLLAFAMVWGWIVILPGAAVPVQAAYTGNAEEDVTVIAQDEDGKVGRFPDAARLGDGTLIAASHWGEVSYHAAYTFDDPLGSIQLTFGSADGKTWSDPYEVITPEKLGQWGLGVYRDENGNFYYTPEDAAANNAEIKVEPRDPNFAVMPDGTVLLTFFLRVPTASNFLGKTLEDASSSGSVYTAAGVFIMYSKDNGQSWSIPTEVKTDVLTRGVAKQGDIAVYSDGQILIPIYGYDEYQSNAMHGSCVLAQLNEDGTWNFIRETRMWGATGNDTSTYTWEGEHAMAVTTLNGQEVTYDLIRRSGNLLISYDRGATWEVVAENVEGSDSWFEGAAEYLQQPTLRNLDGSNKLICTWTQVIGTTGQRNVYGKIYTPGEDWNKTAAVLLYKNNTGGGNDIGDATTLQLTNGELLTVYYDVADRKIGGVFHTVDELTALRSERELVSTATDWKIYDMDFEGYNAGDEVLVQNDLWMSVYGSTKNTVVEEDGNKYLSTTTWASSGSNGCWWFNNVSSDTTISFDIRFASAMTGSGWQQVMLGLGGDWNTSCLAFNNKAAGTEFGIWGSSNMDTAAFATGSWYSVKIIWDDYKAYVKLWQKDTAEPTDFTHVFQNANFNVTGKLFLKTSGGNTNGEQIQLDNICISKKTNLSLVEIDEDTLGYRFDRDVTYELPVPVVTWSSSDASVVAVDTNGNLTYNGAGTATITATCNNLTASKEITVGGWNFIDLDFEDDAAGDWVVPSTYGMSYTNYNKAGATKTIVEDGDNNYLKLAHTSRFSSEIWFNAGPGATLQFDFRMPSTMSSGKWHQLNISLGNTSFNPQWQFVNSAGTTIVRLYDTAAKNAANNVWTAASWYTAKLVWNGNTATLQLWEQGKPETLLYDQTATHSGFTAANAIRIKYANNEVASGVLLDNIVLSKAATLSIVDDGANQLSYSFSPDVTAETPVPNVVWSSDNASVVTVDQNGTMTYVGAGTATVTATCDNLYASKAITVHSVSFDANGHGENPATVLVRSGSRVSEPAMADDGDWLFRGWYNGKTVYDFNHYVVEDLNLVAKWANRNDLYLLNFDEDEPGDYLMQDANGLWMDPYDKGWSWVDDGHFLVLSGAEGDAAIDFWFNNVPIGSTLAFDFRMPSASAGWDRLAIAIGSSDLNYSWRFEQWQGASSIKYPNADGSEQVVSEAFAIGTWYSVKMDWDNDWVYVKMWEQGTEEPADYTFATQNDCFTADSKVRINYVTYAQSYLHLDNIHFTASTTNKVQVIENGHVIGAYETLAEAVENVSDGYIKLLDDISEEITVDAITVDLNGKDLSGITGTVFAFDSYANGYSDLNLGSVSCTGNVVSDWVAPNGNRYIAIASEDGSYSLHRIYVGITTLTLRTAVTGFGYKAEFYADDTVKAMLTSQGYSLWLTENAVVNRTVSQFKETLTLRLQNVDINNYGSAKVSAKVSMTLNNGMVIESATASYSMQDMVELIDTQLDTLSNEKIQAVKTMLEGYNLDWNIPNLLAWEPEA